MPNWVSWENIQDRLNGNNSWDPNVGMERSGLALDKKYYYMVANKVAGEVNMLIQEDGEDFGLKFLENITRPLQSAQFKYVKHKHLYTTNIWAVWGAIRKKALEKTRKEVESKKHETIKEAIRVALRK